MRRRLVLLAVAGIALLAASCDFQLLVPTGDAPLRYRDQIFTDVTKTSNVVYGNALSQTGTPVTLTLDVYKPTGDTATGRPAIVWVHGGSFRAGDKSSAELVDEATTFAKKGFVNVSINYRLAAGGCAPFQPDCLQAIIDAKHDAQAAVRFLRANAATYGIDPTRIAMGGSSAGAITAVNVAYGPEDVGDSGNPGFASTIGAAVSLSGCAILTEPNAGEAPVLLFHGTADTIVPVSCADQTVTKATNAGLVVNITKFDGAGHVPYAANRQTILDQTTNFLYWTLHLAEAPQ